VTHVVFDFDGGGLETLVAEMAARFVGSSVHMSLVTLSGRVGRMGELTRDRFEQFHVLRPRPVVSMVLPLGVARAIRHTRADVVHLHSGSWYKGALAAKLAGVPRVIYTEHGREHDDPPIKRRVDGFAGRLTTTVVAVSERLARYLASDVGINPAKICTIHNGVDTSAFAPGTVSPAFRAALGIADDAFVIGSVGRLETVKAYDSLLDAAALIRDRLSRPFVVVLFGDGSQREALRERAQRLGISDLVRLPGWTNESVQAYRLIDAFVLPSRSEGQSVSLMEAMACGAAPVVTDVGANAEMIGPELKDYVVPVDRPDDLAEALLKVLSPGSPLAKIRASVRRRAVELYGLDRMIEQYERLYRGMPIRSSFAAVDASVSI
jgi:glycosyltransferase involved in cell wall biosynthesis